MSYQAELESFDYCLLEGTYKSRGFYIGFPHFGADRPNTVFIYKADYVPIDSEEVGGFPPGYNGMYRKDNDYYDRYDW